MLIICMLLKVINKVKVTHQGQGQKSRPRWNKKSYNFTYFHTFNPLLHIINMVKVIYQSQSENSMSFQFYVVHNVAQAGGLHLTEMRACCHFCLRWNKKWNWKWKEKLEVKKECIQIQQYPFYTNLTTANVY